MHIGSQLTDLEPYRRAFERVAELVLELRALGLSVARLDLGGGIGIRYHAERPLEPASYAKLVREIFGSLGLALAFEPGRVLSASAGLLVSQVLYVKEGSTRRFVIVDAAMNDLIRPALYDAWHDIVPGSPPGARRFARAGGRRRAGVRNRRHLCASTATCRRLPKATSSPSLRREPMARS